MNEVFEKLTEYTLALKDGLESTNQANERPLLTNHLAKAAEMFAVLHQKGEVSAIHDLVKSEIRSHGWSFISGESGSTIATKWVAFTKAVEIDQHNTYQIA